MRKWIVATVMAVICLAWLSAASADTGFTITETGTNEMTMFKNAGIMQCSTYFNVLFNATGLDENEAIRLTNYSPMVSQFYVWPVEYFGVNGVDGWMGDPVTDEDFYGNLMVEVPEEVLQGLAVGDYPLEFTLSQKGKSATVSFLLHIADALPNAPTAATGFESSYTIRPNETITITPAMQPANWAGNYLTKINFYASKKDGNAFPRQLSGGNEYAVMTGENGEHLLEYSYTDTSMTITGKVPGFYKASISFWAPETNLNYYITIPITVLNADGSQPVYVPPIYFDIDGEMSGMDDSTYVFETVRYKSDLSMSMNVYMYDESGALNDLVENAGTDSPAGQAVITGPNNARYEFELNGYQPYVQPGENLTYLSSGCQIHLGDLPAGDYHGDITLYWYGELIRAETTLHRRVNPTGEPTGVAGVKSLYILRPGESVSLPLRAAPEGWTAPSQPLWSSSVYGIGNDTYANVIYSYEWTGDEIENLTVEYSHEGIISVERGS